MAQSRFSVVRILVVVGAVLIGGWWLWHWPSAHLHLYQVTAPQIWALAGTGAVLIPVLGWYATRPGRTRRDLTGALAASFLFGFLFAVTVGAGALQWVNAQFAPTPPTVVRGVVTRHVGTSVRRRHRRRRGRTTPSIFVRLASTGEELRLGVGDRTEFAEFPVGHTFAYPMRRGALGWWFAARQQ